MANQVVIAETAKQVALLSLPKDDQVKVAAPSQLVEQLKSRARAAKVPYPAYVRLVLATDPLQG